MWNLHNELAENKKRQNLVVFSGGFFTNFYKTKIPCSRSKMPYFTQNNETDKMNDAAIKKYCAEGGCVMGICAGSYLMTNWGFGLLAVDVLDIDSWYRSKSKDVEVTVTNLFNDCTSFVDKTDTKSKISNDDKSQKSMKDQQHNETKLVTY